MPHDERAVMAAHNNADIYEATFDARGFAFLGRRGADGFDAGCIANLSDGCIGVSNVFSLARGSGFAEAAAAVASLAPHLPVVGYAAGPVLQAALRAGFEATGDLRVLAARQPRL